MSKADAYTLHRVNLMARERCVPLYALFELTYRCNQRCLHCYNPSHRHTDESSLREIRDILDQLAAEGTLYLVLTGGEILLRKDIFDICRYAKGKDFALELYTNGTLVTPEVADEIQSIGPLVVGVSLYGANASTHETITRTPRSFQRTIRGVKLLKERGVRVKLKTCIMKENMNEHQEVAALAKSLSVELNFDAGIMPKVDGDHQPLRHRLNSQEFLELLSSDPNYVRGIRQQIAPEGDMGNSLLCAAGRDLVSITPDGKVLACVQMPLPAGNLRQESFYHIWWHSPLLQRIRSLRFCDLETCYHCDIYWLCSQCLALSLRTGQGLTGFSELNCGFAQAKARLWRPEDYPAQPVSTEAQKQKKGVLP